MDHALLGKFPNWHWREQQSVAEYLCRWLELGFAAQLPAAEELEEGDSAFLEHGK